MTALADFLLARIAEDEEAARAATTLGYGWDADGLAGDVYASGDDPQTGTVVAEAPDHADAEHIARHDPARVLAECEAKRRIVGIWQRLEVDDTSEFVVGGGWDPGIGYASDALEHAMRLLTLPYADYPGYREEWRP